MPEIILHTYIHAPLEICFDLSRSVDMHLISAKKTGEKVADGRTSGLLEPGESIIWEAKHFGIRQRLKVKITAMNINHSFTDEMVNGRFKSMKHIHIFEEKQEGTLMTDIFSFTTPYGMAGRFFNTTFLTSYLKEFLKRRNIRIKEFAESDKWKTILT